MKKRYRGLMLVVCVSAAACSRGPARDPVRVRASDLGTLPQGTVVPGQPLIIEVREGEVIPLDVAVDGDLVGTAPDQAPIPLVAKRTFWIRLSEGGLELSRDGQTFGKKGSEPGSFRFGVSATRERGLRGEIGLRTPKP